MSKTRLEPSQASRPFTGAWIETGDHNPYLNGRQGRPFTGAWIETPYCLAEGVIPESPLHGGVD